MLKIVKGKLSDDKNAKMVALMADEILDTIEKMDLREFDAQRITYLFFSAVISVLVDLFIQYAPKETRQEEIENLFMLGRTIFDMEFRRRFEIENH